MNSQLVWLLATLALAQIPWLPSLASPAKACAQVFAAKPTSGADQRPGYATDLKPFGWVYLVTNKITGQTYVGLTAQTLASRFDQHLEHALLLHRDSKFYNALRRYGPAAFAISELEGGRSYADLSLKQEAYIAYYDSFKHGYNSSPGGEVPQEREFRPYDEARKTVVELRFKSRFHYKIWAESDQRPSDIPSEPERIYRLRGWQGWENFLDNPRVTRPQLIYRNYEAAQDYVTRLNLRNPSEYLWWAMSEQRPADIPVEPDRVYSQRGWQGWENFLGNPRVTRPQLIYRNYEAAQDYVTRLNLRNPSEYLWWAMSEQRPADIPVEPDRVYSQRGWRDWESFLCR